MGGGGGGRRLGGGEEEEAVSLSLATHDFVKLEVISAREITLLMHSLNAAAAFGLAYTLAIVIMANTAFRRDAPSPAGGGVNLRFALLPPAINWGLAVANVVTFVYALTLGVIFTVRIVRLPARRRTDEQVWVVLLMILITVYLNPYEATLRMVHLGKHSVTNSSWYRPANGVYDVIRDTTCAGSTLVYVWAAVESFGVLDGRRFGWRFYAPKGAFLVVMAALKFTAWAAYKVSLSRMPLASLASMLTLYLSPGLTWHMPGVVLASLLTALEVAVLLWIVRQVLLSKAALRSADYMRHRTKQIGFRFFLYHNITFFVIYWACFMALLLLMPTGPQMLAMGFFQISYFEIQNVLFGPNVLLLVYITVQAYVNLPSDAIGLRGWFSPQMPASRGDLVPIMYRARERPSRSPAAVSETAVNTFTMQTHVAMLNFAWMVYYYGTEKMGQLKREHDFLRHRVDAFIRHDDTDTSVLLLDAPDRIIISFKGTSSIRNLRTDVKAFRVRAERVLPSAPSAAELAAGVTDKPSPSAQEHWLNNPGVRRDALLHKGFAQAYTHVAPALMTSLRRLYGRRPRPVFLTGHSLGGSLATLCSLDIALRLGLERRDIFVSTFGAPRVGNRAFRDAYNGVVPVHWRLILAPDVVAKLPLPSVGYTHVGKKVLLTSASDLFLDPHLLELRLWHGDAASIVYHRKASYLTAIVNWCARHHGPEYIPEFWNWPVGGSAQFGGGTASSASTSPNSSRRHGASGGSASPGEGEFRLSMGDGVELNSDVDTLSEDEDEGGASDEGDASSSSTRPFTTTTTTTVTTTTIVIPRGRSRSRRGRRGGGGGGGARSTAGGGGGGTTVSVGDSVGDEALTLPSRTRRRLGADGRRPPTDIDDDADDADVAGVGRLGCGWRACFLASPSRPPPLAPPPGAAVSDRIGARDALVDALGSNRHGRRWRQRRPPRRRRQRRRRHVQQRRWWRAQRAERRRRQAPPPERAAAL